MRRISINPRDPVSALQEIQRASHDSDVIDIAQNFTFTGTPTQTLNLNVSSPTATNIALVLATLLQIMQKGGLNKTT